MSFLRSTPGLLLIGILIIAGTFQIYGAWHDSGTMDELAHIPAGYGYAKYLDYRLNPEHPPLVKLMAGLPLLELGLNFPTNSDHWTKDVNGQWDTGRQFLYDSGNNADQIFRIARLGPILLTLLLILLVFLWAKSLVGPYWALLPTFLTAFSPTILGHGHFVTTDIGAALGALLATFAFVRFMERPTWPRIILAGVAYGIAQLLKFSMILLIPCFGIIFLVFLIARNYRHHKFQEAWPSYASLGRYILGVLAIAIIGYGLIVYPVYAILTQNYPADKQLSDSEYILTTYAGGPTAPGHSCALLRCPADLALKMISVPTLRPLSEYLLGLMMVTQRTIGGNTAYFLGEVSNRGSILYFPVLYLTKEPLATLVFLLIALLWTIQAIRRRTKAKGTADTFTDYVTHNLSAFALATWLFIYWAVTLKSPLNIGVRHLLPTFPFAYLLGALAWHRVVGTIHPPEGQTIFHYLVAGFRAAVGQAIKYITLAILLIWFSFSVLASFPYYISYFNRMGGGTMNGYKIATDSNYDWGQDLYRLRDWVATYNRCVDKQKTSSNPISCPPDIEKDLGQPPIDKIAMDYFGSGNPAYTLNGLTQVEDWGSAKGNPSTSSGQDPAEPQMDADLNADGKESIGDNPSSNPREGSGIKWFAISVNSLQGAIQPAIKDLNRKPEDEYRWLSELRNPERAQRVEGPINSRRFTPSLSRGDIPAPDFRIGTSILIYKL